MDWNQIIFWFLSSVVGAGTIVLFDLVAKNYSEGKTRTNSKVDFLLTHIKDYGSLVSLYQFLATYSSKAIRDKSGKLKLDESGELIMEYKILEPDARFDEGLKAMNGNGIKAAITYKIFTIRLAESEALDIASELDPYGKLKEQFQDLYGKTVSEIDKILENKNPENEKQLFLEIMKALKDADISRQTIRANVQKYLK